MNKNNMKHLFTLTMLLVFGILSPVIDSKGDLLFSIKAFLSRHYFIGCLVISPVLLNMIFVAYVWKDGNFDSKHEMRFTWIFVILNIWPPYQAFKLIRDIIGNKEQTMWENKKRRLEYQAFAIEPWIESIPQYVISVCIFAHYLVKEELWSHSEVCQLVHLVESNFSRNTIRVEDIFGEETLTLPTRVIFPINATFSFCIGVRSIILYLNNGPLKITSQNFSWQLILCKLVYVTLSFLSVIIIFLSYGYVAQTHFCLHEYSIFFVFLVFYVIVPFLLFIAPLIRHLGLGDYGRMMIRNPQFIILPLVTDYVIGPINGYGKGKICCCKWWKCCCWMFCCEKCNFEHGTKVGIHKKLSLAKMIYKQLIVNSLIVFGAIRSSIQKEITGYVMLGAIFIEMFCFVMSLYLGHFSTIDIDKFEEWGEDQCGATKFENTKNFFKVLEQENINEK